MSNKTQLEESVEEATFETEKDLPVDKHEEKIQKIKDYIEWRKNSEKERAAVKKIRRLLVEHYNAEIEKRISAYVNGKGNIPDPLKRIRITREAYDKANLIARKVVEMAGAPVEIHAWALNPREKQEKGDIAIRDLYIAHDQEVTPSHCKATSSGKIKSYWDIKKNTDQKVVGYMHSHGYFMPFLSLTDKENLDGLVFDHGISFEINLLDDEEGEDEVIYRAKYAVSIIFNALGSKPFGALGITYKPLSEDGLASAKTVSKTTPIEVIDESNNISLDPEEIAEQISQRVYYNGCLIGEASSKKEDNPSEHVSLDDLLARIILMEKQVKSFADENISCLQSLKKDLKAFYGEKTS